MDPECVSLLWELIGDFGTTAVVDLWMWVTGRAREIDYYVNVFGPCGIFYRIRVYKR